MGRSGKPAVGREVSPQAVYSYLYSSVIPGPETVFDGVRALPPGTCLVYRRGQLEEHVYWAPEFDEHADVDANEGYPAP